MKEYIVTQRANATTKTGSPYANIKVANLDEIINVAVWDLAPAQQPVVGQIVSFYAMKGDEGKKSCNRADVKVGPMPDETHPLYGLIPRPITRDVWDKTLQHLVGYCTDEGLVAIIQDFGAKLYRPYSEYPAATTVHHAFQGGLLNHTHQLLTMLDGIYPVLPYPVKIERCILAILFHDYGKVYEYTHSGEATQDMFLLGHIYIGAHKLHNELEKQGIPDEEIKRIVHCVLAHHGTREFGSPVLPCTQEAELVNHLDELSAKFDSIEHTGHMEKSFALGTTVVK